MADKLQGTWVFDKVDGVHTDSGHSSKLWYFNFTANGKSFTSMSISSEDFPNNIYNSTSTYRIVFGGGDELIYLIQPYYALYTEYATIQIHSTYDEVEDAETLVKVLTARATHTADTSEDINIPMTSAKGVILKTGGKYCEKDIVVTPELEELTVTENGEYIPTKAGYSKVSVNVESGGGDELKCLEERVAEANMPSVTKLKTSLFSSDTTLTSVSIPNVTEVGGSCFYSCSNLKTVSMPKVEKLGYRAFYKCQNLVLTELPSSLKTIGGECFHTCTNITLTELPSELTLIDSITFAYCTNLKLSSLPNGITNIAASAFYNCTNITLTELPSELTEIGASAFSGCTNITLTKIPDKVTKISDGAFKGCTKIETIELSSALMNVSQNPFENCTGLTTVTFKTKPTGISSSWFKGCTNLTTINVPWAEGAVSYAPWGATNATINYNYTGG